MSESPITRDELREMFQKNSAVSNAFSFSPAKFEECLDLILQELDKAVEGAELKLIDERDSLETRLDSLSEAVAAYFGKDIGEHSSMNDPWFNAFEMLRDNTTSNERGL